MTEMLYMKGDAISHSLLTLPWTTSKLQRLATSIANREICMVSKLFLSFLYFIIVFIAFAWSGYGLITFDGSYATPKCCSK